MQLAIDFAMREVTAMAWIFGTAQSPSEPTFILLAVAVARGFALSPKLS